MIIGHNMIMIMKMKMKKMKYDIRLLLKKKLNGLLTTYKKRQDPPKSMKAASKPIKAPKGVTYNELYNAILGVERRWL